MLACWFEFWSEFLGVDIKKIRLDNDSLFLCSRYRFYFAIAVVTEFSRNIRRVLREKGYTTK